MAIAPIQFPQYQINSTVDPSQWATLANLGNVYKNSQSEALKANTLAQLGPDIAANSNLLISSGHPELAAMGLRLQQQQVENQRAQAAQGIQQQQLGISQSREAREAATYEEDSPEGRTKKLVTAGISPSSPRAQEFIATGKMPALSDPSFEEQVEKRRKVAEQLGMKPDSPGYQSYVATGKMPREDAQPLTATDKKILDTMDEQIISGASSIDSLKRAKGLSLKAYSGPGAGAIGYGTSFLGRSSELGKAGIATENLHNEVMVNVLSQLKATFGAAPTEGERKILVELAGSVNKPDAVRQDILSRAILMAQVRLDQHRRKADNLRGGTYYKPGGGPQVGPGAPAASGAQPPISFTVEP